MKVGVILFFGVTAGLCPRINGQFSPYFMALLENKALKFLDDSIFLLTHFNHSTCILGLIKDRREMLKQLFQNVHTFSISEIESEKRIVRNANLILKKNGTDPQPKMTSSISTETIQNQTEQYLNISVPNMPITGTDKIKMITILINSLTTHLNNYAEENNVTLNTIKENFNSSKPNNISINQNNTSTLQNSPTAPLINNYTEQYIATSTDNVIKENNLLPISLDQKIFFYDPLIFAVISITLLIAGTLFYLPELI